ncbi:MAG: Mfa1 family fimbria major subunit [Muribaculaceae bacterium]|nr:Mfa1 family fimbria major subunit [Muribaculaceae bacterium]
MKKIYGFAFAAAIMSLASCSNDSEPVVNPTPGEETPAGFVSFHISSANSTRAGQDDGFDDGETYERTANDATFLFFDGTGVQTQAPQTIALTFKPNASNDAPAVSDISDPVVAVSGRDDKKPTEAVVILNCPSTIDFNGKSKTEVLSLVTNATVDTKDAFVMSNAAYFNGSTKVIATPLVDAAGNSAVYATRDKAAESPVNIYVERLAAKVQISFATTNGITTTNFEPSTTDIDINGKGKVTILPVITGMTLANQAQSMYLVKNVGEWSALDINDAANFRVNWAITPENTPLKNFSYNVLTDGVTDWKAYASAPVYIRENTLANGVTYENGTTDDKISRKTSVLLTAKLVIKNGTEVEELTDGLVRWAGIYYTPTQFKVQACNFLRDYYIVDEEATAEDKTGAIHYKNFADPSMLTYMSMEDHETYLDQNLKQWQTILKVDASKLPTEVYTYDKDSEKYVAFTGNLAETLNSVLAEKDNRFWYWTQGYAYYFVEIAAGNKAIVEGTGDDQTTDSTYEYGVVRNNSYSISLRSLSGLGVPVYNPDEDIIPQTPDEKLWFVGARINILKWRMVSQAADFNGNY